MDEQNIEKEFGEVVIRSKKSVVYIHFGRMFKEMFMTLVWLPVHLVMAIYACFAQLFCQWQYDIKNNYSITEVRKDRRNEIQR